MAKCLVFCLVRSEAFASRDLRVSQLSFGKFLVGCHGGFSEEWLLSGCSILNEIPSVQFFHLQKRTLDPET